MLEKWVLFATLQIDSPWFSPKGWSPLLSSHVSKNSGLALVALGMSVCA